jgi:peptidyl-prolyl cis-trans isomerase B (cyclophilin B)
MKYLYILAAFMLVVLAVAACHQRPDQKATYTPASSSGAPATVAGNAPPTPPANADQTANPPADQGAAGTETGAAAPAEGSGTPADASSEPAKDEQAKEGEKKDETKKDEEVKPVEPAKPLITPASQLPSRMNKVTEAMFETSRGNFIVDIYPEIAPISAPHFISLIRAGFYDNIRIHRYEPGFVIQMGQVFSEDGQNTPLYPNDKRKAELGATTIQDEPCLSENTDMTISFAKTNDANSASCQFFINLGDNRRLDTYNHGFTVMGIVVHGQDIVRRLRVGDSIGRAYLLQPSDVK